MSKEVQEEFQRFRKEEIGHLFTYYATENIEKAAEKWKCKSVSFKSPKSGRIFRTKKLSEKTITKTDEKEKSKERFSLNRWSKLFNDFGKSKVSDFEYQQPKVRESSSYKPFWATKVVQAFRKPNNDTPTKTEKFENNATISFMQNERTVASKTTVSFLENEKSMTIFANEVESMTISKHVETVERNKDVSKGFSFVKDGVTTPKFTLTNKGFTFVKDGVASPALAKAKDDKVDASTKRRSTLVHHQEHRLRLPPFYKGSELYMPSGERLFWVRNQLIHWLI